MPYLPLPSLEVIQEGRSYLKSALVIEQSGDRELWRPACVLAGFAMELFIKSFLAKDDSRPFTLPNGVEAYSGAVASTRGHDLHQLFNKISAEWRTAIQDTSERLRPGYPLGQHIKEYAGYFFHGRYSFEAESIGVIRMEVLDAAEHLERVCTELLTEVVQP